jgi:redox-sensitive bicupin YhaK (pirin superfamily)
MIDLELQEDSAASLDVGQGLDTAILYVYEGSLASLNGNKEPIEAGNVVLMDANLDDRRGLQLQTTNSKASVLLFAGKKLNEPIAWHGPIVMNTQAQVRETLMELRTGRFPPKRVDWDYKRLASKPTDPQA